MMTTRKNTDSPSGTYYANQRPRGMGIMNIDVQNQCMLSNWLYKLINENGIWQELLKRKYMSNKSIGQVQ
jgi:hypothetical protein